MKFVPFIYFISASSWKLHDLFMYSIISIEGKQRQSRKPLLSYLVFRYKQLRCENTSDRVFIIVRGMTMSWSLLRTLFIVPSFGRLFSWLYFTLSQFSTCLFHWRVLILLHPFIKIYVWLLLIRVCYLSYWASPTNVTSVNVLAITSIYYLQGKFILIYVWCVTNRPFSTNVSPTSIRCTNPLGQKQNISAPISYYYLKHYPWWIVHDYYT